jgi:hypothetical protein
VILVKHIFSAGEAKQAFYKESDVTIDVKKPPKMPASFHLVVIQVLLVQTSMKEFDFLVVFKNQFHFRGYTRKFFQNTLKILPNIYGLFHHVQVFFAKRAIMNPDQAG